MGHTVEELAAVANVSVEAIQRAIQMRQQQLIADQNASIQQKQNDMLKQTTIPSTTTMRQPTRPPTTTTTIRPTTEKYTMAGGSKVS